jgi:CheY-like chemotaxis protein
VDLHDRLIASSETLLSIINDILDFSKIEAGLLTLEAVPFTVDDVFKRLVTSMEIKASQKSIKLTCSIDPQIAPVLEGDPTRLGQVLLNLVSNAIKFTDKGEVTVTSKLINAEDGKDTLYFAVKDTGIGIDPSRIERIFESYEQESLSTTRQFGGTGLGLSISRQLVELMGGRLMVDSVKNQGSTFHFSITLPVGNDSGLNNNKNEIEIDPEKLRGVRVLVVEDNDMNQFVAKSILLKWNMQVFQAKNGKQAIEFLEADECDIVLMDKQMPIMGGVEATYYLRQTMHSEIPIIALTADAVIEMVQECLAAGMNAYITKPFEPVELYRQIIKVLNLG